MQEVGNCSDQWSNSRTYCDRVFKGLFNMILINPEIFHSLSAVIHCSRSNSPQLYDKEMQREEDSHFHRTYARQMLNATLHPFFLSQPIIPWLKPWTPAIPRLSFRFFRNGTHRQHSHTPFYLGSPSRLGTENSMVSRFQYLERYRYLSPSVPCRWLSFMSSETLLVYLQLKSRAEFQWVTATLTGASSMVERNYRLIRAADGIRKRIPTQGTDIQSTETSC
ncbi:hypothetical protein C8J56DRAFT_949808, partial [Mycena floridula]